MNLVCIMEISTVQNTGIQANSAVGLRLWGCEPQTVICVPLLLQVWAWGEF